MEVNEKLHKVLRLLGNLAEIFRWRFFGLPSSADRAERGRFGEWCARCHLARKGLYVLFVNWRNPSDLRDEIDLICKEREVLVFVEVRARTAGAPVSGYHSISARKKKALLKACRSYLNSRRERPDHFRFDVVEVDLPEDGNEKPKIFHHENVALFPSRFH